MTENETLTIENLIELIESELDSLRIYHKQKAVKLARELYPEITEEDLLNPDDFSKLMQDSAFVYEDGVTAGVLSAKIAVRALLKRKSEMDSIINSAKDFLYDRFQKFPHYSFGDGNIMYEHSLQVHNFATKLAHKIKANLMVVELCAIFHDIGKTLDLDHEILERDHEVLGWKVVKEFLNSQKLSNEDLSKIESFFNAEDSVERNIVKDADIIAFYADKRLQKEYLTWAKQQGEPRNNELIQKKWGKFDKLNFKESKEIAFEYYQASLASIAMK